VPSSEVSGHPDQARVTLRSPIRNVYKFFMTGMPDAGSGPVVLFFRLEVLQTLLRVIPPNRGNDFPVFPVFFPHHQFNSVSGNRSGFYTPFTGGNHLSYRSAYGQFSLENARP